MRADAGGTVRALALCAALIVALSTAALAEGDLFARFGVDALSRQSQALGGVDVRALCESLLTGKLGLDEDWMNDALRRFAASLKRALTDALTLLAAPVLASLALRSLIDGGGAIGLVCRMGCAALLTERFVRARAVAAAALDASAKLIDAAAPVLATALTLTGSAGKAAILTPSAALCAKLISDVFSDAGLPLCGVVAIVAAAANLSDRFQLNRLLALMKRGLNWAVSLTLGAFVGLMALQGLLASGQDALTARALRRMIQAALPVIGGEVSDSAGALLGSAIAARNAVGVAGMLAVMGVCAAPLARLAVSSLSLRLAAAALEPVADPGVVKIAAGFADAHQLLLAISAGAALMSVLCLGACLALAG